MRATFKNLLATTTSGLLVLAPFIILIHVLQKALGWISSITAPLTAWLGLDGPGSKLTVLILEALVMAAVCLLAGHLLKAQWFKRVVAHSEDMVIRIAQALNYVDKAKADALQKYDGKERRHWNTVLVSVDGAWSIAFEMERDPGGQVTLFFPDAPSGDRGSVRRLSVGTIDLRPVPEEAALKVLKAHGKGLSELLAAHPRT